MACKTTIIGISGPSASGKSVLSNNIVNELGSDRVVVISEDAYYKNHPHLSFEERQKINYDHPEAFDHDLLAEHLKLLQAGETVQVPIHDFSNYLRSTKTREVGQHALIVLEGILLFSHREVRNMMDIRIFVDTPLDICLLRRLRRDIKERGRDLESVLQQYEETVRPMYLQFIEPSKRYADIIVPRGGENRIAIEIIQAKMREMLE
jgi:uridine kinase